VLRLPETKLSFLVSTCPAATKPPSLSRLWGMYRPSPPCPICASSYKVCVEATHRGRKTPPPHRCSPCPKIYRPRLHVPSTSFSFRTSITLLSMMQMTFLINPTRSRIPSNATTITTPQGPSSSLKGLIYLRIEGTTQHALFLLLGDLVDQSFPSQGGSDVLQRLTFHLI